ncbi:MAG: tRNA pseudouridine(38-40) synthase TruA [Spirochaetota bacterium]
MPPGERTIALELCYDGSRFHGLQVQHGVLTIQGLVEEALERIVGRHVRIRFAGRTDAGVHAMGQVVSFTCASRMDPGAFRAALNALLPPDIRVLRGWEAPPGFHPRYDAAARWYRYLIDWHPERIPFFFRYSLWVHREPDLDLLRSYGEQVVGEHDFTSFATLERGENPRRAVFECRMRGKDRFLAIDIVGNAFLRKMVRTLVGTFLELERERQPARAVADILHRKDRAAAGQTAYAGGLYLMKVFFGSRGS